MKLFVIHRFKDRTYAKKKLKNLARDLSLEIQPIFLDSFGGEEWKQKAEISLESAVANIQLSAPEDLKFNIEKEGFVTLGMKKRNVENPKFTLTINSVLGLVGFEEY